MQVLPTAYAAVETERIYQGLRWPGHTHPAGSYLSYIDSYLRKAGDIDATTDASKKQAQETIRKIVAMAVACMEENGVIVRGAESIPITAPVDRVAVFGAILFEREYQARFHPSREPDADRPLEVSEELTLMRVYLRLAEQTWITREEAALNFLRKMAACGIRCMERHGAPMRYVANIPGEHNGKPLPAYPAQVPCDLDFLERLRQSQPKM